MKRVKDVLFGIAGTIVATIGIVVALLNGIWALILREDYKVEAFYAEHPLLREMRGAPTHFTPQGDRPAMTEVLVRRIPLGTKRSDALAIMASEKINCQRAVGLVVRDKLLVCAPKGRPCNVARWHIELEFDEQDGLSTGRVFPLKDTCET